ncbi:hypothetical protein [Salirhabdus salicampi]|uniref:hypothetical protein n=1 Tax=Salirhabdus salicampi TaxID=476102 RepID=UPI0020C31CC1|nr:hypothetical protein [Salirhabdus salicampi]MCP8617891.1 hypothetical protein [Salirhabdus salicampi]
MQIYKDQANYQPFWRNQSYNTTYQQQPNQQNKVTNHPQLNETKGFQNETGSQKNNLQSMQNVLNNYYSMKSGFNSSGDLKKQLNQLAEKSISYRVDKHSEKFESKVHNFKMEISREAHEAYSKSRQNNSAAHPSENRNNASVNGQANRNDKAATASNGKNISNENADNKGRSQSSANDENRSASNHTENETYTNQVENRGRTESNVKNQSRTNYTENNSTASGNSSSSTAATEAARGTQVQTKDTNVEVQRGDGFMYNQTDNTTSQEGVSSRTSVQNDGTWEGMNTSVNKDTTV